MNFGELKRAILAAEAAGIVDTNEVYVNCDLDKLSAVIPKYYVRSSGMAITCRNEEDQEKCLAIYNEKYPWSEAWKDRGVLIMDEDTCEYEDEDEDEDDED